jgi:putative phage-type endonuclease
MALTTEQREARKKYLGSSDLPAVVGVDTWRNASDVWLEKTGRVVRDDKDSPIQEVGHAFETAVIDLFAKRKGVTVERNVFLVNEMFCANLDGLIDGPFPEIVEAKTTGKDEEWGPEGTDEIPERILIQVHEQMYVTSCATGRECHVAWVPVLIPGFRHLEVRTYRVERNGVLMDAAIGIGSKFWNEHIVTDTPPDVFLPSLDMLKRARREPDKIVDVSDSLVERWFEANEKEKAAKKEAEQAKVALIASLGDAEGGQYSKGIVTYYSQHRAGYTVEPTSYRVLRKTKGSK